MHKLLYLSLFAPFLAHAADQKITIDIPIHFHHNTTTHAFIHTIPNSENLRLRDITHNINNTLNLQGDLIFTSKLSGQRIKVTRDNSRLSDFNHDVYGLSFKVNPTALCNQSHTKTEYIAHI